MKRLLTNKLIIHHTASPRNTTIEHIREWHKEKGFTDINGKAGYHFFINQEGIIIPERPEDEWGCAVKNANNDSISIAVIGDFRFLIPNPMQVNSLINLLFDLMVKYKLPYHRIYGHRDIKWWFVFSSTATECPGDQLYKMLPGIRKEVGIRLGQIPDDKNIGSGAIT